MRSQPAPHNLLRLSFDSLADYQAYERANGALLDEIWLWHESFGDRADAFEIPGLCDLCNRASAFRAGPRAMPPGDRFRFRVPWRLSLFCDCGMFALGRAVMRALLDTGGTAGRVYHVGHYSPFRRWLAERAPGLVSSQYRPGGRPGDIVDGVRHEDLAALSFPDREFDSVVCMEVLEHVPDHRRCLGEIARVLKPHGRALLTFPWLGSGHYEHATRAEMLPDGSIRHLQPPEYHDDPADPRGALSYRDFGWRILDELRDAGFSRAFARFLFGPLHGHMTLLTPVVVAVR